MIPDGPVALLGYPAHRNVGDHAIWLGQTAYLRRRGLPVAHAADSHKPRLDRLASAVGDRGTIVFSGGGNLGDLYPREQRFREAVTEAFPRARIVYLPQSIHFTSPEARDHTAAVLGGHPDLTLLVRDEAALEEARGLGCRTELCPDMAFALGPLSSPVEPSRAIVWLARRDEEVAGEPLPGGDWPELEPDLRWRGEYALRRLAARARGDVRDTLDPLSSRRLREGLGFLGSGRVVVTDRLHGHVLSLLLGRPHVLVDNRTGKLSAFSRAWTAGSGLTHWASSPGEAEEIARGLTSGGSEPR